MLGDFIYSADTVRDETTASYRYDTPRKVEKAAKRFLLFAVVGITGGIIWLFAINPCMVPARVTVKSFSGLDRTEVLNIAGISGDAAYISINAAEAERRLSGYYLVEQAKVVKRFPDRLSIFLEPRRAVAVVFAQVNGRTQPVYFDRHGVAIGMGNGTAEALPSWLPIVSGVLDEDKPVRPGMKLSASYVSLFSRIGAISDEDTGIWKAISEIGIVHKDDGLFDLMLYPVHNPIKLRMRSDISRDSLTYGLLIFDVYRQYGTAVPAEIDVRSGIGVVSVKEGSLDK